MIQSAIVPQAQALGQHHIVTHTSPIAPRLIIEPHAETQRHGEKLYKTASNVAFSYATSDICGVAVHCSHHVNPAQHQGTNGLNTCFFAIFTSVSPRLRVKIFFLTVYG